MVADARLLASSSLLALRYLRCVVAVATAAASGQCPPPPRALLSAPHWRAHVEQVLHGATTPKPQRGPSDSGFAPVIPPEHPASNVDSSQMSPPMGPWLGHRGCVP